MPEKTSPALDIADIFGYNIWDFGVWRSLVSRLVRVQEASGSNPDTPTKKTRAASAALSLFWGHMLSNVGKLVKDLHVSLRIYIFAITNKV